MEVEMESIPVILPEVGTDAYHILTNYHFPVLMMRRYHKMWEASEYESQRSIIFYRLYIQFARIVQGAFG